MKSVLEKHSTSSSEESPENIIGIKLVLSELVVIPSPEVILCTMLIINPSLVGIAQAGESCAYLLEGVSGVGSTILVRVKFQSELLVCFLDFLIGCSLS